MILPEELTTVRLRLRRPDPEDCSTLFPLCFSDPEVMRYLTWRLHREQDETRALLHTLAVRWKNGTQAHWVLALRNDPRAIGIISLRLETRANLSYLLAQECWRQGLMTEAAAAVCGWALDRAGIDHLWAFCDTENFASVRLLVKIGFQEEARLPHYSVFPNISAEARDCLLFVRRRT